MLLVMKVLVDRDLHAFYILVKSIQLISFLAECSALDYHGTSRRLFVGLDDGAISVSAYESCLAQADNDQQYIHYCETP